MHRATVGRLCAAFALVGGALVAAQQLPSEPSKQFGTSVTGAFEGWFDSSDGTRSFLVGYFNRNIGAASGHSHRTRSNRIEPGGPDLGQPTHFCPAGSTACSSCRFRKASLPSSG